MSNLLYEELTYRIRAILYEVYNTLGSGFREETYKRAVLGEMRRQGLQVAHEKIYDIHFKGELIDQYRLDIVVEDKIILELKATENLHPRHEAQLLSYLKASKLRLGLLVNFGSSELKIERFVN